MRVLVATAVGLAALAGCSRAPEEPEVKVQRAAVTLPAVPGRPGAAYFTLKTNTSPTNLIGVTSPLVQRIELHDSGTRGGVSRMTPLEETVFPARGILEFKPGGKHAMLFGIDSSVKPGGTIPLTFTFDPAPAVTVEAEVHAPGAFEAH
ncbi:MAG: copper chaperone PCu(A)C [Pseudomonadota bacterium]|nr:copper chaperone PCu(A)C [Pseudomonadota bacterium]